MFYTTVWILFQTQMQSYGFFLKQPNTFSIFFLVNFQFRKLDFFVYIDLPNYPKV